MRMMYACWVAAILLLGATGSHAELLQRGDAFPEWELSDHTGAQVSARGLAGKIYLVWFYPRAMTPGCTIEGQTLRDRYPAFQMADIRVYGVSFDPPERNAEFVRQERLPFALLSDSERKLAIAVGAAGSPDQGAARRISYLVGRDGKVLKAYGSVSPASHADEVLRDASVLGR